MNLVIDSGAGSPADAPCEVVERKGLGHPDSICDALAEAASAALCEEYLRSAGRVLHFNVDKVLLCGGASRATLGGGEILAPIEIYVAGRVTPIPAARSGRAEEVVVEACRAWLRERLRVDVENGVRIIPKIREGSRELVTLFEHGRAVGLANDSSCGVGFAPLTPLERSVLAVEQCLNASAAKERHPAIGEDVKVLGVRRGSTVELTVACAMVAAHIQNADDYKRQTGVVESIARAVAEGATGADVDIFVNAADDVDAGRLYLTVTGTSAEAGDDGEVGRGNRVNGLITPYRPMTLEAAAGKNPITHTGKLYNVLAYRIAARVARDVGGVQGASCLVASRIGAPIDDPSLVHVRLLAPDGIPAEARSAIADAVGAELQALPELTKALVAGRISVF
jgi:S-adenosylmethionine synthetase